MVQIVKICLGQTFNNNLVQSSGALGLPGLPDYIARATSRVFLEYIPQKNYFRKLFKFASHQQRQASAHAFLVLRSAYPRFPAGHLSHCSVLVSYNFRPSVYSSHVTYTGHPRSRAAAGSSSLAFYWHSKKVIGPPLCPRWLTKRRTYRPRSVIYHILVDKAVRK